MEQLVAGVVDDVGDPVDPILGQCPISCVNAVTDSRENRGVVAGPQLWTKDDVSELCAVGNLYKSLARVERWFKQNINLHLRLLPSQVDLYQRQPFEHYGSPAGLP